jgi:uncharacterized membrane protein YfhO
MEQGQVNIQSWSPNRVEIQANGSADKVIISEMNYPGWQVWVDGVRQPIETHGLFRAVTIADGYHTIVFSFVPISVFVGSGISVLAWVCMIVLMIFQSKSLK